MKRRSLVVAAALCVVAALTAIPSPATVREPQQDVESIKEVYTGTLMGIGGAASGRTIGFTLTLNGRVSRSATLRYVALLKEKGQDALLKQLDGRDLGSFAVTGRTGRTVNFAYERSTPEGRQLIVVFERWIELFEVRYGLRSQNYPFSYLEISFDNDGDKGQGTFIGAARLYFDDDTPDTLTVENFATYPLRVVDVERQK
jgi:hypothetical protein